MTNSYATLQDAINDVNTIDASEIGTDTRKMAADMVQRIYDEYTILPAVIGTTLADRAFYLIYTHDNKSLILYQPTSGDNWDIIRASPNLEFEEYRTVTLETGVTWLNAK